MKLRINPLVVTDLKAIKEYTAEDNAEAARKTVDEIYKRIDLNLENEYNENGKRIRNATIVN